MLPRMRRAELAAHLQRAEGVSVGAYLDASPALAREAGDATTRIDGVICLTSTRIDTPFLNRALGVGTIATITPRLLDRIGSHYARHGRATTIAVATGCVPAAQLRLLERRGYAPTSTAGQLIYTYVRGRLPPMPDIADLVIERAGPKDARMYAETGAASFPERGPGFVPIIESLIQSRRRGVHAFLGRIAGVPAATGMLFDVGPVAALGNGSVLAAFRGRGLQKALIVHRMRDAYARGKRIFFGETENPASAHNLDDLGWRLLFTEVDWTRTS
jgi:hypothetical protein